jgi:hypothetical protein
VGHTAYMMRNVHKSLLKNTEENRPLERSRYRFSRKCPVTDCYKHDNKSSGYIKNWKFL